MRIICATSILVFLLSACATVTHWGSRPDFSKIDVGMSKSEVISALGKPEDIAANGEVMYLTYTYAPWYDHNGADGNKEYYFVRLVHNQVDAYGHRGDFDSTQSPERTINLNIDKN